MSSITEIIAPIKLLAGTHEDTAKTGSGCFMNVIAYLNGEPQITDQSPCVCVTVRAFYADAYADAYASADANAYAKKMAAELKAELFHAGLRYLDDVLPHVDAVAPEVLERGAALVRTCTDAVSA